MIEFRGNGSTGVMLITTQRPSREGRFRHLVWGGVLRLRWSLTAPVLVLVCMVALWASEFAAIVLVHIPQRDYDVWGLALYMGAPFAGACACSVLWLYACSAADLVLVRTELLTVDVATSVLSARAKPLLLAAIVAAVAAGLLWVGALVGDVVAWMDICFLAVFGACVAPVWGWVHGTIRLLRANSTVTPGAMISIAASVGVFMAAAKVGLWVYALGDRFQWWLIPPPT